MSELDWLYGVQGIGVKLGLENMRRLIAAMPPPDQVPTTIHVVGTNGKGSTCAFAESMVRAHGMKVGLFSSPHLVHYSERIQVDRQPIPEADYERLLGELRVLVRDWEPHPSFFELTLALALRYFYEQSIDYLILETGLGGRLDATNALEPRHVSVITPISLDHTSILGDTLAKIATEKAGIMREGVPIVSASQAPEALEALLAAADSLENGVHVVTEPTHSELGLLGEHQRVNAAVALASVQASGLAMNEEKVQLGLRTTQWPGRFQRLGAEDRYVVDGAHNHAAIEALVQTWQKHYGAEKATVIFGCTKEKPATKFLEMLSSISDQLIFTGFRSSRAQDPISVQGLTPIDRTPNIGAALSRAKNSPNRVLITGSLFLIGEAIAALAGHTTPVPTVQ